VISTTAAHVAAATTGRSVRLAQKGSEALAVVVLHWHLTSHLPLGALEYAMMVPRSRKKGVYVLIGEMINLTYGAALFARGTGHRFVVVS
jgi:hypothetical protein